MYSKNVGYINKKSAACGDTNGSGLIWSLTFISYRDTTMCCKGSLFVLLRKIFDVYLHIIN
nr:MAG TPA: hypothetical protein [Bacteriophage sp.]